MGNYKRFSQYIMQCIIPSISLHPESRLVQVQIYDFFSTIGCGHFQQEVRNLVLLVTDGEKYLEDAWETP